MSKKKKKNNSSSQHSTQKQNISGNDQSPKSSNENETKNLKELKLFTLKCISFIAIFLGLLYTINSDIIVQNNNLLLPPFSLLFSEKVDAKSFDELLNSGPAAQEPGERTYIFALDTSKSIKTWEMPKPFWFDDAVDKINSVLTKYKSQFILENSQRPTGYDISKVRLSQLLLEIIVDHNAKFAIWKFGDKVAISLLMDSIFFR